MVARVLIPVLALFMAMAIGETHLRQKAEREREEYARLLLDLNARMAEVEAQINMAMLEAAAERLRLHTPTFTVMNENPWEETDE